jgi:hypothetical protein
MGHFHWFAGAALSNGSHDFHSRMFRASRSSFSAWGQCYDFLSIFASGKHFGNFMLKIHHFQDNRNFGQKIGQNYLNS